MKQIKGQIRTNKHHSEATFEFEVDDDTTAEEIEQMAREAAFDLIDWGYTVDGEPV